MLLNGPIRIEKYIVTLSLLYKVHLITMLYKVEKILKGCQNSISSPSPSLKIQIMCGKVCLRCKGKTLLAGCCQQTFERKTFVDNGQQCFAFYLSSKLSRLQYEFSLKGKVMELNAGYLLKSILLYFRSFFNPLLRASLKEEGGNSGHSLFPPNNKYWKEFSLLLRYTKRCKTALLKSCWIANFSIDIM